MRFIFIFVVFFSITIKAQQPKLIVAIDSIIIKNPHQKIRSFYLYYHIQNTTDKPISFFLKPKSLIANAASSATLYPVYRIYQNGILSNLDGPFFENDSAIYAELALLEDQNSVEAKNLYQKYAEEYWSNKKTIIDTYKNNGGKVAEEPWIFENQAILRSRIILNPKEIKSFIIQTSWDKKRYFNQNDIEYYLDEKDTFLIDLTLELKLNAFQSYLSEEEFKNFKKDVTLIEGSFVSNKMKIDLSE